MAKEVFEHLKEEARRLNEHVDHIDKLGEKLEAFSLPMRRNLGHVIDKLEIANGRLRDVIRVLKRAQTKAGESGEPKK